MLLLLGCGDGVGVVTSGGRGAGGATSGCGAVDATAYTCGAGAKTFTVTFSDVLLVLFVFTLILI